MKSVNNGIRLRPRNEVEFLAAKKAEARGAVVREFRKLRQDLKAAPLRWVRRHIWWATGAALTAGAVLPRVAVSAARRAASPPPAPPPSPRPGGLGQWLRSALPQTAELLRTVVTGIIGGTIVTRVQEKSARSTSDCAPGDAAGPSSA